MGSGDYRATGAMGRITVEFEGKEYKRDFRGKYRCPHLCSPPNYPPRGWVSDKGFAKHLSECAFKPPERPVVEEFVPGWWKDCPDCGKPIMKLASVWWMHEKIVCIDCHAPYLAAGVGHHDAAGLELPGVTLFG